MTENSKILCLERLKIECKPIPAPSQFTLSPSSASKENKLETLKGQREELKTVSAGRKLKPQTHTKKMPKLNSPQAHAVVCVPLFASVNFSYLFPI